MAIDHLEIAYITSCKCRHLTKGFTLKLQITNLLIYFQPFLDSALLTSVFDKNNTWARVSWLEYCMWTQGGHLNVKLTYGETDITDRQCVCYVWTLSLNVRGSKVCLHFWGKMKILVFTPSLKFIIIIDSLQFTLLGAFETYKKRLRNCTIFICTVILAFVWCLRSWTLLRAETHTHVLHFPLWCRAGKQTLIQIVCLVVCLNRHHTERHGTNADMSGCCSEETKSALHAWSDFRLNCLRASTDVIIFCFNVM